MKLFISSVLILQIASVLSVYIPKTELNGDVKLEPLENIYSNHIPQYLVPLNLTTGELKLFAGHSFQLIKAKCPAVSQEKLALISKYIAKLIARNNPVPGSSVVFKDLIANVVECTDHTMTEEEKAQQEKSFFQLFLYPFRGLESLFELSDVPATDNTDVSSTTVPYALPDTIPLDTQSESVQIMDQKEGNMDSAAPAVGKDGDDDDDFAIVSSTINPNNAQKEIELDDSPNTPYIRVIYPDNGDGDSNNSFAPWNPLGWLGGIFKAMEDFFSGFLGAPSMDRDVSINAAPAPDQQRNKRDADNTVAKVKPIELIEIAQAPAMVIEKVETKAPAPNAKQTFMKLIDNLCRIYCAECNGQKQAHNFKAAAKELYQLILTDTTGIELASKHFLEPEFLQSLNEC